MIIGKTRTNQPVEDEGQVEGLIEEMVEGGTLDNAKPIYWHGLDIYDGTNKNAFQCHVLKNDNTPIDTIEKLKQWAESISGRVVIAGNGCVKIGSSWYQMYCLIKGASNDYSLYYVVPETGYAGINNINVDDYFTNCEDAVNKIN